VKYKVNELEGEQLDEAVARIEGWYRAAPVINGRQFSERWWHEKFGDPKKPMLGANPFWSPAYSQRWDAAGPIIERERIAIFVCGDGEWTEWAAEMRPGDADWIESDRWEADGLGLTPLVAAMRAYVASKLGQEIELPGMR